MNKLHNMKATPEMLREGLKENALKHKNYNMYTSMDRAMCLLLTGNLYISNGATWNDVQDRATMKKCSAYGICMSCSTIESMAMWILYSGERGKNGAMIQFVPSIIKEIINTATIELGKFGDDKAFVSAPFVLSRKNNDFSIYMTDVVYTAAQKDPKLLKATVGSDNEIMLWDLLEEAKAFHKHYAWSYEKECRLIVELSPKMKEYAEANGLNMICIRLSETARRALVSRVVRSPIYRGNTDFGKISALQGSIDWEI